jgi:starch synthase
LEVYATSRFKHDSLETTTKTQVHASLQGGPFVSSNAAPRIALPTNFSTILRRDLRRACHTLNKTGFGLPPAMQITQAVFGVFHHFELAHQLHRRNHLRRIYSTWPWARLKREGLPRPLVRSFPLIHTTDYMLRRTPLYSAALDMRFNKWNSDSFDAWLRRVVDPCDALIAISGAGATSGPRVQANGGKFICDRGSTHQRFQNEVLAEEYRRRGLTPPSPPDHIVRREEQIYALADAITVPSQVARLSFLKMGVAAEKVHVIPYGVRLDQFFRTEDPPADSFEVLFAGQVSLRKGIPYLLEALARVRHPRKRLTIVGTVQDDLRPLLATLPQKDVTYTGNIPRAELAERMGRSHVLVLPSVEEGLALVQGQALACGLPVIATTATGAQDLFTDGVEGFIVADRDTDALTARMQQLADDPALQQQMSAAAQARVKDLGGWDTYGDRWDALLHTLTGIPMDPGEEDTDQRG